MKVHEGFDYHCNGINVIYIDFNVYLPYEF